MIMRLPFLELTCVWLFASVTEAVKIDVISSPGNVVRVLEVCDHQLPEDAAADFLARQGIHNENFVPIQSEYNYLMERICNEALTETTANETVTQSCARIDRSNASPIYPKPTSFINPDNIFVTLYFYDKSHLLEPDQPGPFGLPVYLRNGYTHVDHAVCACNKVSCTIEEYEAVEEYLRNILKDIVPTV